MLSIKKIGKKNIWLFLLPLLLLIIIVVFFKFISLNEQINTKEEYIQVVQPRLERLVAEPTKENIKETRDFLFNINSSDRSIGDYHLPLYMAFSLWTKYAESKNLVEMSKAIGILEELRIQLPEMDATINKLIKVLKNNA